MARARRKARTATPRASDSEALVSHGVLPAPLLVPSDEPGVAVSVGDLATHLDITPSRVAQLSNEGVLPRNRDGTYPVDAARVAYIRSLRRAASVRTKREGKGDALMDAKTRKAELEVAVATGELVNYQDAENKIVEAFSGLRNELAGIGASVTRDLQLRAAIDEKINDAVDRVRATLEAAAKAAFSDSEDDVEIEEAAA